MTGGGIGDPQRCHQNNDQIQSTKLHHPIISLSSGHGL
jgi:hypothetical protein